MAEVGLPFGRDETEDNGNRQGVLLYYKYAPVPDVAALVALYESNCSSLGLLGRVRIGPDGVNVTVGGKMACLVKHIDTMKEMSLFEGTDFKLAACDGPSDERVAKECGFTSLSVRVVKELVTFRSHPSLESPSICNAGRHLSAAEFNSVLNGANHHGSTGHKELVLLDARNVYETRIGMFQTPNVETMNPEIRQYSDLPTWIDHHSEMLKDKHVLMYCTGGIRCEMASAYIRSKGTGFENVFQLYGGIQRYLEEFPNGGFFKGKNFVFDHRISVGSKSNNTVGSCLLCGSSFDDYSSRCRCIHCRMLVLVCDSCQENSTGPYICELCEKHGKADIMAPSLGDGKNLGSLPCSSDNKESDLCSVMRNTALREIAGNGNRDNVSRKLRILCLHGFRQNASSFKGRTASLSKKLRQLAEFVFVDGPHELPFIYLQKPAGDPVADWPPPVETCKKRFAWLIAPEAKYPEGAPDWELADGSFDPLQYQQQTHGFEESYTYLKSLISKGGPFDGFLGFSQGAAMAALACQEMQRLDSGTTPDFRFVILCSGFHVDLMKEKSDEQKDELIKIPSLHVFGSHKGHDRQINCDASRELAEYFDKSRSLVIEHDMGHIIPTRTPYLDQIKAFLRGFL